MRILVTGGRDFALPNEVHRILHGLHRTAPIIELAHGGAEGLDELAKLWALSMGIVTAEYECSDHEWAVWGNRAGNIRNSRMLRDFKPTVGVAFPGGNGTKDMREKLIAAGIKTCVGRWADIDHTSIKWKLENNG